MSNLDCWQSNGEAFERRKTGLGHGMTPCYLYLKNMLPAKRVQKDKTRSGGDKEETPARRLAQKSSSRRHRGVSERGAGNYGFKVLEQGENSCQGDPVRKWGKPRIHP